jgi:GNAT superfamily N-acetyltransferase
VVRTASPQDAPLVARMLHDFNEEFEEPAPPVGVLTERLAEQLARDDVVVLLAGEEDGLALLTFRPTVWDAGPVALLEELYVVPERRSRGIGRELVERAFAVSRERGVATFQVNVDEPDVDAQRFYERHGVRRSALYFERQL